MTPKPAHSLTAYWKCTALSARCVSLTFFETHERNRDAIADRAEDVAILEIRGPIQITSAEQRHGTAMPKPSGFASGNGQRRDVGQRGLHRKEDIRKLRTMA